MLLNKSLIPQTSQAEGFKWVKLNDNKAVEGYAESYLRQQHKKKKSQIQTEISFKIFVGNVKTKETKKSKAKRKKLNTSEMMSAAENTAQ